MRELIEVLEKFDSLETVIAELKAYEGEETIEDIAEYLEDELSYQDYYYQEY